MNTNVITAVFGALRETKVRPRYRYNRGQVLVLKGIRDLPDFYEVHFANIGGEVDATPEIGTAEGVIIPDSFFESAAGILAYIYVHDDATDGTTIYKVTIPIIDRPRPADTEPTEEEADIISQAIVALNENVGRAEESAETAQSAADGAAQAERNAGVSAERAEAAEQAAETSATGASSSAAAAQAAAMSAAESESQASAHKDAAMEAADDANAASASASDHASAAQSAAGQAEQYKNTAMAAGNAAQTAATNAGAARTAAQTAQAAAEAAQTAAEGARSAAETARTDAQTYAGQASQSATDAAQSAAGAAQTLGQVRAEGAAQVAAVDAEGQRVLDSIPEDYSQMEDDITDLKSQIEEISQSGIDASGATAGQVPTADGEGSWSWADQAGGGGGAVIQPEKIQAIVATGKARDYFEIGDVIYIPWTNYTPSTPIVYQLPFVVVHIGDTYDNQDVKHENALWLMAMYAEPEEMVFDAAEDWVVNLSEEPNALAGWYYWGLTGTEYTALNLSAGDTIPTTYDSVHKCVFNQLNTLRYGYNRWSKSAYRQWLNSAAAKNANWWTSQHDGDVAPTTTYTNKPGWLYGFEDRWLDIIKPVKVQTACNTVIDGGVTDVTYDRFFLPSLEQMYGSPQIAGVEGDYWEYWKEETGLDAPSNGSSGDTNDARKIPSVVNYPRGSAVYVRLRSAYRSYSHYVWNVYYAGYLGINYACTAYRALPACVIY